VPQDITDVDLDREPLSLPHARKLILHIVDVGIIHYTDHALEQMAKPERDLCATDCLNVLRAGRVAQVDYVEGAWRYRVETATMAVVVEFESYQDLIVVTAWRF
jgi:hypothetical protein